MLNIPHLHSARFCDGSSRRDFLRVVGLSLFGLSLHNVLQLQEAAKAAPSPRFAGATGFGAAKSVVLLFLLSGSVVIPLKAVVLNVISLGASLGLTVLVFQHGHLEGLLGFESVGALESVIPLLVLAFGFGLSSSCPCSCSSMTRESRKTS